MNGVTWKATFMPFPAVHWRVPSSKRLAIADSLQAGGLDVRRKRLQRQTDRVGRAAPSARTVVAMASARRMTGFRLVALEVSASAVPWRGKSPWE
jgi:hypothetical protein